MGPRALLVLAMLFMAGSALAQEGAGSPAQAEPAAPAHPSDSSAATPPPAARDARGPGEGGGASHWNGPRVELAYRVRSLRDSLGGRSANTAVFSGFLPTRQFRGGGGVEAGSRAYEYGAGEGVLIGHLFAGYQHLRDLGRWVPYVVAVGELGLLFGKRFHTPETRMIRGAGLELGADVNLVRTLYVGFGLGFMLYTMDDLAYDSFGLRLAIGL